MKPETGIYKCLENVNVREDGLEGVREDGCQEGLAVEDAGGDREVEGHREDPEGDPLERD